MRLCYYHVQELCFDTVLCWHHPWLGLDLVLTWSCACVLIFLVDSLWCFFFFFFPCFHFSKSYLFICIQVSSFFNTVCTWHLWQSWYYATLHDTEVKSWLTTTTIQRNNMWHDAWSRVLAEKFYDIFGVGLKCTYVCYRCTPLQVKLHFLYRTILSSKDPVVK